MVRPNILVLRAPGTNCDEETAFAFDRAGGASARIHVNRLLENPAILKDFQVLCIPGGFSFGDDVAAGRIFANQIRHHLADLFQEFREAGKLILGICNGFQVLMKCGLLGTDDSLGPAATLTWNDSGRFMDCWVKLQIQTSRPPCVYLEGLEQLYLPIAHAEGKFVTRDKASWDQFQQAGQLVLRYQPAETLQGNPNGSQGDVAGMCDTSGRVFGLMPHPERFIEPTQHPTWTRNREDSSPEALQEGEGLQLFRNAMNYFQ